MPGCGSDREERDHRRAGVSRDPDRAGRKCGFSMEEADRLAVLKEIPVGREARAFAATKCLHDPPHAGWGGVDHVQVMRTPEVGHRVEEKARGCPGGDGRDRVALVVEHLADVVERPKMAGDEHDAVPAGQRVVEE